MGWLKVGRLKKLLEDESYRVMLVAKINKTLDRKVGPDDHIDDVVCIRQHLSAFQNLSYADSSTLKKILV